MESVEIFAQILAESWNNNESLVRILKNSAEYLSNVPENDREKALEIVFDETRGLFKLIDRILCMLNTEIKYFTTSLKECFFTLQYIIENFQQDFKPYLLKTKEKCFDCIKTMCWFSARKSAAYTLKKLIEFFPDQLELDEFVSYYNYSYSRTYKTKRDGSILFIVVGAIAKYSYKTNNLFYSVNSIFLELLTCIKQMQDKLNNEEVKIYLDCITDMLTNFVPYEDQNEKKLQYFKNLYDCLLLVCRSKSQKVVRNRAINILTTHSKHFSTFMFGDYKKWHEQLNNILEENTNYTTLSALRSFYKMMAVELLEKDKEDVFLYFKNYFLTKLANPDLPTFKTNLMIYGLGEFSVTYKKYSPTELGSLYRDIALRASTLNEIDRGTILDAEYLKTLSQILHEIPNVSPQHISMISQLSVNFIKRFPELSNNFNYELNALKKTFSNINQLEKSHQDEYFNSFFHKGILLSCSHTLSVDVELQQELQNLSEKPVCYKNYVPLWCSLFVLDDSGFPKSLTEEIFNKFSTILTSFIGKLNLNVKAEEEVFFMTTSYSLKAENEADFRFFINLVDLYVDVFEKVETSLFQNWINKFLLCFVKLSYKHPLISGFYKLIEVIFKKSDIFSDHENFFSKTAMELLSQYLLDVITQVPEFLGELQLACINLIFSTPTLLFENLVNEMTPVFKIAFNIGLTNLPLAFQALDTVDKMVKCSSINCSDEFLKNIVSYVDPFLSSEESLMKFQEDKPQTKKLGTSEISKNNENLENLQAKILLFFGCLDSTILFDFVHEKAINTNATWNKKNLLQCELLFPDIRLEVNFDKFIPRIIELTSSGNHRTKISACEILHTMITIILGKKLMDQCFDKSICHTILKLGCDGDDRVRLLYHPLVLQLTHYLSSKFMKDSRVPQEFLGTLFDGLTEEFNPSLRDYCGFYLKEFIQWSVQQSNEGVNLKSVVRRIVNFALYPSNKKRVAAAVAFNHLYTVLRENMVVVDTYWLVFFHAFIKSMEDCDNAQIVNALGHVEKVIIAKATIFNANSRNRRKPPGFSSETLSGFMIWLFEYCGRADTRCRWKCMEIFNNLLPCVANREYFEDRLMSVAEKIEFDSGDAKAFLRSLDFYSWMVERKILPLESLENMRSFLSQRNTFDSYFAKCGDYKNDDSVDLKNETTLKILEYLSIILRSQINYQNIVSWSDDLIELIVQCTLNPWKIGFTFKKLLVLEQLQNQLENLFANMVQSLDKTQLQQLRNVFLTEVKNHHLDFMEVDYIVKSTEETNNINQFFKGVFIMKKSNFLNLKSKLNLTLDLLKSKIHGVFKILKVEVLGSDSCTDLDHGTKDNLNDLMQFLLEDPEPETYRLLIRLIFKQDPLITLNGSTTSHGEFFLQNFKDSIFASMLENPIEFMKTLQEHLIDSTDDTFNLLEKLLTYASDIKTPNSEILGGLVVENFSKFYRLLNDLESRELRFLSINRMAVNLHKKPIKDSELYSWIVERLMKTDDLEKKTSALRNFLAHMVDSKDSGLSIVLGQLRNSEESSRFQVAQALLKTLLENKSIGMYEVVVNFCAGACNKNIQEFLGLYFKDISDELALKSLRVTYKVLNDLNPDQERLDVLKYFLIPSIESSQLTVVQEFCDENWQDMTSMIKRSLESLNIVDRKKLIVSQLGYYSVFETLFTRDLKFDDTLGSILVKQSLEHRRYTRKSEEEKEIVRLMHCAAFNCCVAVVSRLKKEESWYRFVFSENREKGQLIWEKIIDCDIKYSFQDATTTIRKNRKKLVNIRNTTKSSDDGFKSPYQHCDLTALSLVENLNAYDLNDLKVSEETTDTSDARLALSFENDELNEHECMPMVCGLLIHVFNNEITKLNSTENLPAYLVLLRNSFLTEHDNVRLYLMKIISNTKNAFLPFMRSFFGAIAQAVCGYLKSNQLNYIVRDILVIIIESEYKPTDEKETKACQSLLERLIDRARDPHKAIYKYNLELIESLCKMWIDHLEYPGNINDRVANTDPDLAIQMILTLLRCGNEKMTKSIVEKPFVYTFVKSSLDTSMKDNESVALVKFETMGWLLRNSDLDRCQKDMPYLVDLLSTAHQAGSYERCARCVCALYRVCPSRDKCHQLWHFAHPRNVPDDTKPECLELVLLKLPELAVASTPEQINLELRNIDLEVVLSQRLSGCEDPALRIVLALMDGNLVDVGKLQFFLELVITGFTGTSSTVRENRKLAYSVLMKAYERESFKRTCTRALIRALDDPDEELQEFVLSFWRDKVGLPDTAAERLAKLLEMYSSELQDSFGRFLCLMMLQLTSKSIDANRVMFAPLADNLAYRELQLLVPRRRSNWGSMAPMFVPSLASQFNQFLQLSQFSQQPASSSQFQFFSNSLRLLATKELEFEPTAPSGVKALENNKISSRKLPDPSENKLSKRITRFTPLLDQETFQAPREPSSKMKNEIINRQKSVKIYRKYRNGDFPDVEITHDSFIKCLKQLIVNDWLSCKNLVVALVCNLINRLQGTSKYLNFKTTVSKVFEHVLQEEVGTNNFSPMIMEIIYQSKVITPEPMSITRMCNDSLGVLLLEDLCLDQDDKVDDNPPSKRMKPSSSDPEKWIQLATLNKKIGKDDVVTSIFRYKEFFSKNIRDGVLAQAIEDWKSAEKAYDQTNLLLEVERDYCLQSSFECLSQLSSWKDINKKIDVLLNEDLNTVWESPKRKQLLPWIFQANLHSALDDYTSSKDLENLSFIENLESWMGTRSAEMKQDYGEEISIFYSCDKGSLDKSRFCLRYHLDHLRRQWIQLSPLAETERYNVLLKLQRMFIIHTYLKLQNSMDIETEISDTLHYWERHCCPVEDLLNLDKNITYRLTFEQLMKVELDLKEESGTPEFSGLSEKLTMATVNQRIKMSESALLNRNKHISKKHVSQAEQILHELGLEDSTFILTASKYKFVCGQSEASEKRKYKYFIDSWKIAAAILDKDNLDISAEINTRTHLFDLASTLTKCIENNPEHKNYLIGNSLVCSLLSIETDDFENLPEALEKYGFECLKNACEVGKDKKIAETYVKFGKHCYDLLTASEEQGAFDDVLFKEFMSSILTGMSFGSLDAAHYFPCLLKTQYYKESKTTDLFISKTDDIPSWLFLSWQTQIMSFMGEPLVADIVKRLVRDYPKGVMFNFRQVYESSPKLKSNSEVRKMYDELFKDSRIEDFFQALHRVCQPEYFLRYHLLELLKTSTEECLEVSSLDKIFSSLENKSSLYGLVYRELERHRKEYSSSKNADNKIPRKKLCAMADALYTGMRERLGDKKRKNQALQLRDYSPYLSNFSSDDLDIEIPGQYDGTRKPLPRYHVRISKFDRFVMVMESKCFPVKINVIGNDSNTYGFLVKFGEDLRQDQRLQQIFGIVNKTLSSDQICKQRHLSINTYHVAPLSSSLGLIQWIEQTKTLREFVEFSINKEVIKETRDNYQYWIGNYKEALLKYSPKDVVSKMNEFASSLQSDCLKNTFLMLSPSLECFLSLRHNFITNYATMCVVHWVTGVGDRHLENTLVEVKSGKCYGIDFGMAFGAGVDLTPPELVPFRLTPQILGLLKPFDERALLGTTMTHVLNALTREGNRLLACFDIFVSEPLDWGRGGNKEVTESTADVKWSPKNKIKIVKRKLNGDKPSAIMCQELSYVHGCEMEVDDAISHFSHYTKYVNGTDPTHPTSRASIKNSGLTADEQVQCLLDQAKDFNLLGRMYFGWEPFV